MRVKFYRTPKTEQDSAKFLFQDDYALLVQGQTIEKHGEKFCVNSMEWPNDERKVLHAFCSEMPTSHPELVSGSVVR